MRQDLSHIRLNSGHGLVYDLDEMVHGSDLGLRWRGRRQGTFWVVGVGGVAGCGYGLVVVTAALSWQK